MIKTAQDYIAFANLGEKEYKIDFDENDIALLYINQLNLSSNLEGYIEVKRTLQGLTLASIDDNYLSANTNKYTYIYTVFIWDFTYRICDKENITLSNIEKESEPCEERESETSIISVNLVEGMIPVKFDNDTGATLKADSKNQDNDWYDYDNKKWANVVLVNDTSRAGYKSASIGTPIAEADILGYLVWIPRYKYKLWNANNASSNPQEIYIEFENKTTNPSCGGHPLLGKNCTDAYEHNGHYSSASRIYKTGTNGEWLTHPAFRFGDKELNGFWVGKFASTGSIVTACTNETCLTANLTIKPNLNSIRNQTVSSMFYATRSMNRSDNQYGIDANQVNTHMAKNIEWGAVAYLSHSIYGQNTAITINNSIAGITGCAGATLNAVAVSGCPYPYTNTQRQKASTTGTIYGVYDMRAKDEYVMGNMNDSVGSFYPNASGFNNTTVLYPKNKYYDSYEYEPNYECSTAGPTNDGCFNHSRGYLGDATKETIKSFGVPTVIGGWYGNDDRLPYGDQSWFKRSFYDGGTRSGIFAFGGYTGKSHLDFSWHIIFTAE